MVKAEFDRIKSILGDSEYRRLFAVILTDNGTGITHQFSTKAVAEQRDALQHRPSVIR